MRWDGNRDASDLMATRGWGKCSRCGTPHESLVRRGPCQPCLDKEQERQMFDRIATPEKLRHHPDLDEIEKELENWYG